MILRLVKVLVSAGLGVIIGVVLLQTIMFFTIPQSYIKEINTSSYKQSSVKEALDIFNIMADYEVFTSKGLRPVYIEENDVILDKLSNDPDTITVGLAVSTAFSCRVYIRSGLSPLRMFQVLIHEAGGHCMGFGHTLEENDLMNAVDSGNVTVENMIVWAQKIRSRIEHWRI